MRSAQIAEWILALFLEPDRAAAYAGDLMEEAAEHPPVWFWSSVARLAIMRFWYDIAESPFFLAGVLIRACLLNFALAMAFVFGFGILAVLSALLATLLHAELGTPLPGLEQGRWIGSIAGLAIFTLSAFYTGRWIAARMPGREIVACVAMNAAQALFYLVPGGGLYYLITFIGFLAGGLRTRLRRAPQ